MSLADGSVCVLLRAAAQSCKSYAALGGWCQESSGNCCGGGPKNAKCRSTHRRMLH